MNNTPKISLIMSVYNGEDYLAEAIESVLNQTFEDWELIVINDCSTDSTGEILAKYESLDARVKVHTNEVNLRLPSSLNKALELAEGKYVARMDADDICLPDRLQKQFDFMEKNGDVSLSSCRFMTLKNGVVSSGGCGGKVDFDSIKALLLVTNLILHPGIIAKSEVIKKLGYDKNFVIFDSADQKTLIKECMKETNIDEKLFPVQYIIGEISKAKNTLVEPIQYMNMYQTDFRLSKVGAVYSLYQKKLNLLGVVLLLPEDLLWAFPQKQE